MNTIDCKEAKLLGLSRYYTGRPCKRGHVAERYTNSGNCIACDNERCNSAYHSSEEVRQYSKAYSQAWSAANRDRINERQRRWDAANLPKRRADNMKRHAAKLHRTPSWSETEAIEAFYAACPAGHEVDHIFPLQGRLVSGLHVIGNLQYLPAEVNRIKGNRYVV